MLRRVAAGVALFVAGAPIWLAASGAASPPRGHLVVVGGGGVPDNVQQRALAISGGRAAVVAVLPQASELADTGETAAAMWLKAGAARAVQIDLSNLNAATQALSEATLIWFPGGDQNRLTKALAGTGLPELIRQRYIGGATVGGTSAGAAVLSAVMITGDADLQSITASKTVTAPGLGLWPEVIVDQHFLKRQRMNRLISAVLDQPQLVGVGIDEKTAVIVTGGHEFEVVGDSSVVVIDARRARVSQVAPNELASGTELRLHVLTHGMTFTLNTR